MIFQPIAWRSNPQVNRLHIGWSSLHAEQQTILRWPCDSRKGCIRAHGVRLPLTHTHTHGFRALPHLCTPRSQSGHQDSLAFPSSRFSPSLCNPWSSCALHTASSPNSPQGTKSEHSSAAASWGHISPLNIRRSCPLPGSGSHRPAFVGAGRSGDGGREVPNSNHSADTQGFRPEQGWWCRVSLWKSLGAPHPPQRPSRG